MLSILLASVVGTFVSIGLNRSIQCFPEDQTLALPLRCNACQHRFPWRTHLPLMGFFLVKGRCPSCQKPLSFQTFWVELCAIVGTIGIFLWREEPSQRMIDLVFLYAMIVIAFIDWNLMLIEPRIIVWAVVLRLGWLAWFEAHALLYYFGSMLIGAGAFYFIAFFYETLRRQPGLGDGDAAVLGLIGLWVGWEALSWTILLAALTGLIITSGVLVVKKQPLRTTQVPFAPFLCLAGGFVYYAQNEIFDLNSGNLFLF